MISLQKTFTKTMDSQAAGEQSATLSGSDPSDRPWPGRRQGVLQIVRRGIQPFCWIYINCSISIVMISILQIVPGCLTIHFASFNEQTLEMEDMNGVFFKHIV